MGISGREYSKDYVKDEEIAKQAQKGIWQGEFQTPAQWRREKKGRGGGVKENPPKGARLPSF